MVGHPHVAGKGYKGTGEAVLALHLEPCCRGLALVGQRNMDSPVALRVTVAVSLLGAKPPEYCTAELSLER